MIRCTLLLLCFVGCAGLSSGQVDPGIDAKTKAKLKKLWAECHDRGGHLKVEYDNRVRPPKIVPFCEIPKPTVSQWEAKEK